MALGLTLAGAGFASGQGSAPEVYSRHCAACHGADRLGAIGPALLPENLRRLRKKAASGVIANGRVATQMPAFGDTLTELEIDQLVELVYTPLPEPPHWGADEIRASHLIHNRIEDLPNTPRFSADPLNLFVVVELGDHHATLLDGDTFQPIHRFKTRFSLHGGPKYSPDGRFVYLASRDGWITKYDIYNLKPVAEIRAGINTRNLAVSEDGRYVMVGNYLPHTLVALEARDLTPLAVIPVEGDDGRSSRISAVYAAPPRHTFVAALKDIPEIWELSYAERAPPGFSALTDGYSLSRGPGFSLRRIALRGVLDDFFFDQDYVLVVGASRDGSGQVVNLDSGEPAGAIDLPGLPHLGSGITWNYQGRTVLATPNLKEGVVSVIDLQSRRTIKRIKTQGPGFFMRSHEGSRYAWVDVFFGPHRDAVHVIDKSKLEIAKTLIPAPGKTSAHVEFTRDGRYALLSIWDMDGAVVVYDARTLEEVKRIPMKKPSGKYNVYNKITRSRGTSH